MSLIPADFSNLFPSPLDEPKGESEGACSDGCVDAEGGPESLGLLLSGDAAGLCRTPGSKICFAPLNAVVYQPKHAAGQG